MEQEITYKKCSKCGEEKPLTSEYFYKDKFSSLGFRYDCKICYKLSRKKYYDDNKEKILEECKNYYNKNREDKILKRKNYYLNNSKDIIKKKKKYYLNNRDLILENKKKYYKDNLEEIKKYKKLRYNNGGKEISNLWFRNKRSEDKLFKLSTNIRNLIGNNFRKKNWNKKSKTQDYLKCDYKTFKEHIESQFTDGMSWDNQGQWHLDHYYPVSLAQTEEDMYIFNHYTNFQPLWAEDNLSKSNKVPDGFEEWYEMMKKKVL